MLAQNSLLVKTTVAPVELFEGGLSGMDEDAVVAAVEVEEAGVIVGAQGVVSEGTLTVQSITATPTLSNCRGEMRGAAEEDGSKEERVAEDEGEGAEKSKLGSKEQDKPFTLKAAQPFY